MSDIGIAITLLGFFIWMVVAYRAVRTRQDLVVLALVLTVMGLIAATLLDYVGIEAPGSWAFLGAGVLLLILWPRDRGGHP